MTFAAAASLFLLGLVTGIVAVHVWFMIDNPKNRRPHGDAHS